MDCQDINPNVKEDSVMNGDNMFTGRIFRWAGTALLLLGLVTTDVTAQQRIDETKAARADGLVRIDNLAGSVKVTGWNRAEVAVKGTLGEGTERLDFTVSENETIIKVIIMDEDERRRRNIQVKGSDLQISVPAGSRLDVQTVSADITVTDVTGDVELESVSGDIEVGGRPARVRAKCISGDITIAASAGPVRANSVSGRITVHEVTGRFDVGTISGGVKVTGRAIEEGNFESLSGDLYFEGDLAANANLSMENHSGSIDLVLPANISADFDVTTFSGDIENGFGQEPERRGRYMPGKTLSFVTGGGDARIRINTFSGDVEIIKK